MGTPRRRTSALIGHKGDILNDDANLLREQYGPGFEKLAAKLQAHSKIVLTP